MREEIRKYLEKRTNVIGNKSVYDNLDYNTELVIIEIKNMCERYNLDFYKVEILGKGESSVVFGIGDKAFKITFMFYNNYETLKEFVSYSQDILQVDDETVINLIDSVFPIRILLSKRLTMVSVTEEELFDMYVKLRDAGYLWADLRSENIGRNENGNLLLLDYGELININEMDENQRRISFAPVGYRCQIWTIGFQYNLL